MTDPLLELNDLTIQYETRGGMITAVSNASLTIGQGEYFGLVGESGCGKSTLLKAVLHGLDQNGNIESGDILYRGRDMTELNEREISRELRWNEISWIPQGSMSSLDPLQRISKQASEITEVHAGWSEEKTVERLQNLFEIVGLPEDRVTDYPHQFSGGMQQRALIAFSLLLDPSLIIADEPTTALDVIMQDQVFKHLDEIRGKTGASLLLVTHDISVVFESCDRMAIMHAGQVSEIGSVETIFDESRHPYSILLQRAFPDIQQLDQELEIIPGHPPKNIGEVNSCTFAERCPWAVEECRQSAPKLEAIENKETHKVACFRKNEIDEEDHS